MAGYMDILHLEVFGTSGNIKHLQTESCHITAVAGAFRQYCCRASVEVGITGIIDVLVYPVHDCLGCIHSLFVLDYCQCLFLDTAMYSACFDFSVVDFVLDFLVLDCDLLGTVDEFAIDEFVEFGLA